MAGYSASSWQALLTEAEALLKQGKHFDGVQKINSCMELFETEVGGSDSKILKEPVAFLEEFVAKLSPEQKTGLTKMFTIRGDLLIGLGATKRAATEYTCASTLAPDEEGIKTKLAQLTAAGSADKIKPDSDSKVPVSVLT